MREGNMHKAEYDIKVIMYPAYSTHHRLRTIRSDPNIVNFKFNDGTLIDSEDILIAISIRSEMFGLICCGLIIRYSFTIVDVAPLKFGNR